MTQLPSLGWPYILPLSWALLVLLPATLAAFLLNEYIKHLYRHHHELWLSLNCPCGPIWKPPACDPLQAKAAYTKLLIALVSCKHAVPTGDQRATALLRWSKLFAISAIAGFATVIGSVLLLAIWMFTGAILFANT
jgi:hypothetical protein